jgi:hypothetical protein
MRLARPPALAVAVFTFVAVARTAAAADANPPDGGAPAPEVTPAAAGADGGVPEESSGSLFEQSLTASEKPAGVAPGATPALPVTFGGYVRGDTFIGRVPNENQGLVTAAYGELSLNVRTAKGANGDGFAEVRIRHGLQGETSGLLIDAREAYANLYAGPFDLRLGQQIIVWGRADALNPTNNLTPVDFRIRSPLEDDIRLGNVGARAFLRLGLARLEGVWMPTYLATELPPVGLPPLVVFGPPVFPGPDLRNGLIAGRAHLELAAFEASVSYLRGYAPLPGLTLSDLRFDTLNPAVIVARTAYQQQVVGLDFSTALGEVATIRGEAAYRRPYDYQQRPYAARPDLQYALGADHNFGSFSVIAQYLGRYVFDWRKEPGTTRASELAGILGDPTREMDFRESVTDEINLELAQVNQILFSQTAKVQHIATLRFEWLLAHETLSISSLCLLNFTTQEWLVTPRIGWRATDAMTAYVGAQVFAGPNDTLFGLIDQTLSAGYAELRFTY